MKPLFALFLMLVGACALAQAAELPKQLLEEKCLSCHYADKKKGELDLSTRESMLVGGDAGPALFCLLPLYLNALLSPHSLNPQDASQRLECLDILRGFRYSSVPFFEERAKHITVLFKSEPSTHKALILVHCAQKGRPREKAHRRRCCQVASRG
jgi:hypothetical protein